MDENIKILYEDAELIVCHKPAGIAVQSARIAQKDMVSVLKNHLAGEQTKQGDASAENSEKGAARREAPSIYVVHRLDQPVEGVIVFAKTRQAAAGLSRQVSDGSMKKLYQAVCCARADREGDAKRQAAVLSGGKSTGDDHEKICDKKGCDGNRPSPGEKHSLVDYLVKDGRTNASSVAKQGSRDAKRAELSFRVLERRKLGSSRADADCAKRMPEKNGNKTDASCIGKDDGQAELADREGNRYLLTEIELKTGRHHQIRVQMAHAGLPLYGDRKYNERWQAFLTESDRALLSGRSAGAVPLALCAVSLTFRHPSTGKRMRFETTPQAEIFSLF